MIEWNVAFNPPISGQYIVTRLDTTIKNNTNTYVDVGYYNKTTNSWYSNDNNKVVAWIEAPQPYQI